MAWAGTINAIKGKSYKVVHDQVVTSSQAAAVLKALDESGPGANEMTVRGILRKLGINPNHTVHIVRRGSEKIPLVILVANPEAVPAAIAVSDAGCTKDGKNCSQY